MNKMSYRQPSINGTSSPTMPSGGGPPNQLRPNMQAGSIGNGPYMSQPPASGLRPSFQQPSVLGYGGPQSQQFGGSSQPPMFSKGQFSGPLQGAPNSNQGVNRPPFGPTQTLGTSTNNMGQVFHNNYQQQRPGMPPSGFPPASMPNRPPMANGPQGAGMPLRNTGPPARMGPPVSSTSSVSGSVPHQVNAGPHQMGQPSVRPPQVQTSVPQNNQSDGLPAPFHGQGQYSHQVGMQLTPGLTPNNSEPPSQRSSRTPSPMNISQTFDALEGQFTPSNQGEPGKPMTPPLSQDIQGRGTPPKQPPYSQPGSLPPMSNQTYRPPSGMPPRPGFPGQPPSGPTNVRPGQPNFNVQSPSKSGPPPNMYQMGTSAQPGPPSGPSFGMPPSTSQPGPPSGPRIGMPSPPTPGQPGQFGGAQMGIPPPISQLGPPSGPQMGMPPQPPQPGMMPPPLGGGYTSSGQPGMSSRPNYPSSQPQTGNQPHGDGYNSGQYNSMPNIGGMNLSDDSRVVNLLQEKQIVPPNGIENPKIKLHNDFKKVNCSPDIFRCTLTSIPQTSSLLNKSRLPLGILIHPFRDLSQLPVIQSNVIVRCRSCRTYINPFVYFVDQRRWKCNLCYRVNELPEEFNFDPVSKSYGEPQRRPEIKSATIEFIAPSEYMLRPPQPAVYLYLLDVSFNAIETGYLNVFCQTLLDELDKIPSDSRSQIGFLCYDSSLYFFNLEESLSQPQMLIVSDVEDVFLPCPDNLLVNLQESKEMVTNLLNMLPTLFENNRETGSALGAALQAAYKLIHPTGGRVTVVQTVLPTVGPGALESREDPNQRTTKMDKINMFLVSSGYNNQPNLFYYDVVVFTKLKDILKTVSNLGPASDFYKKLALDCSAQQVAVDLIMLNGQYADISTISCISKYSGGSIQYFPSFHCVKNPSLTEKFEADMRRYFTRKIGFEAVMRIRCTKGLSIHTFHGNFFVRSTDLLSLPNINPDAGFGMQMSIEDPLTENSVACFQAALLYTSSKGERRIRVHTMCLPVTNQINEIYAGADQQAIIGLLAKMAADRSVTASLPDAREALLNAAVDPISAYGNTLPSSQRVGSLPTGFSIRLLPLLISALFKSTAFRFGVNTRLDDRVFAMQQCKSLPLQYLIQSIYPHLYPVYKLGELTLVTKDNPEAPESSRLQLSSANIDRTGVYLLDTHDHMYLYVGSAVEDKFCQDVLEVPNFMSIPEGIIDLPELENPLSESVRNFISCLLDNRPGGCTFYVVREDSKLRMEFFQYMVEDRSESSMSYYEFLQHIQKQVKS